MIYFLVSVIINKFHNFSFHLQRGKIVAEDSPRISIMVKIKNRIFRLHCTILTIDKIYNNRLNEKSCTTELFFIFLKSKIKSYSIQLRITQCNTIKQEIAIMSPGIFLFLASMASRLHYTAVFFLKAVN